MLINDAPVNDVIRKTQVDRLDIISADTRLHGAEIELVPRIAREKILAKR